MKTGTVILGTIVSIVLLSAAGAFHFVGGNNAEQHYRTTISLMRQIQQLSSNWSVEIARVRSDPFSDFDSLAAYIPRVARLKAGLIDTTRQITDLPDRLAGDLSAFRSAVNAKGGAHRALQDRARGGAQLRPLPSVGGRKRAPAGRRGGRRRASAKHLRLRRRSEHLAPGRRTMPRSAGSRASSGGLREASVTYPPPPREPRSRISSPTRRSCSRSRSRPRSSIAGRPPTRSRRPRIAWSATSSSSSEGRRCSRPTTRAGPWARLACSRCSGSCSRSFRGPGRRPPPPALPAAGPSPFDSLAPPDRGAAACARGRARAGERGACAPGRRGGGRRERSGAQGRRPKPRRLPPRSPSPSRPRSLRRTTRRGPPLASTNPSWNRRCSARSSSSARPRNLAASAERVGVGMDRLRQSQERLRAVVPGERLPSRGAGRGRSGGRDGDRLRRRERHPPRGEPDRRRGEAPRVVRGPCERPRGPHPGRRQCVHRGGDRRDRSRERRHRRREARRDARDLRPRCPRSA